MKREKRKRKINSNRSIYLTGGILAIAIAVFVITFIIYSNKLEGESYTLDSEYLAQYTNKNNITNENITSASSSIGKTIEELQKSSEEKNITTDKSVNNEISSKQEVYEEKKKVLIEKKAQKDPVFSSPLEGEVTKEFAKDSLIYSETLKEWTTHMGIDIKAEKGTIVKAATDGKVKDIKNDPRYGLTIIIEHSNGFQTLYANLLTTEFVSEGEDVKTGQTIGTVGDSSVYEIVDEPHLHFEILKNSENLDPNKYIQID